MRRWLRTFLHRTGIRRSPSLRVIDAMAGVDWGNAFFENAARE